MKQAILIAIIFLMNFWIYSGGYKAGFADGQYSAGIIRRTL